jgi:hypothetical protein
MSLRTRLWHLRDRLAARVRPRHCEDVFARIYEQNLWGEPDSRSGVGSTRDATRNISRDLPGLWTQYGIRSLVDAPCGDCIWMSRIAPTLDSYVGVDIVPQLIEDNQRRYPKLRFCQADLTRDGLPAADAIHCRDCFQHLPTRLIREALANFEASGARWLLLTTNADVPAYHDVVIGGFRPINFLQPPFNFPQPVADIAEDEFGRALALWDLRQGLASRFRPRPGSDESDRQASSARSSHPGRR